MNIEHVRPGDPLDIPAAAYNAFVDAARAHRRGAPPPAMPTPHAASQSLVYFRNDAGQGLRVGDVVGLDGAPIVPYPPPHPQFWSPPQHIVFSGVTPAERHIHFGFGIVVEPAAVGAIGRACVSGICVTQLRLPCSNAVNLMPHERTCCAIPGTPWGLQVWTRALPPRMHGTALLLWLNGGWRTGGGTGADTAIVLMGHFAPMGPFPVSLQPKGQGTQGLIYDIWDRRFLPERLLAQNVDPCIPPHLWTRPPPRPGLEFFPAWQGMAMYHMGALMLTWIAESWVYVPPREY